jgi:hypothetical protein
MTKFDKVIKEINDLWVFYIQTADIRKKLRKIRKKSAPEKAVEHRRGASG